MDNPKSLYVPRADQNDAPFGFLRVAGLLLVVGARAIVFVVFLFLVAYFPFPVFHPLIFCVLCSSFAPFRVPNGYFKFLQKSNNKYQKDEVRAPKI